MIQRTEIQKPSRMDCRERGSHARGVYPTQETSRIGRANVKHEKDTETRIIARDLRNMEERNVGTKRKYPEQGLAIMLKEGESHEEIISSINI